MAKIFWGMKLNIVKYILILKFVVLILWNFQSLKFKIRVLWCLLFDQNNVCKFLKGNILESYQKNVWASSADLYISGRYFLKCIFTNYSKEMGGEHFYTKPREYKHRSPFKNDYRVRVLVLSPSPLELKKRTFQDGSPVGLMFEWVISEKTNQWRFWKFVLEPEVTIYEMHQHLWL